MAECNRPIALYKRVVVDKMDNLGCLTAAKLPSVPSINAQSICRRGCGRPLRRGGAPDARAVLEIGRHKNRDFVALYLRSIFDSNSIQYSLHFRAIRLLSRLTLGRNFPARPLLALAVRSDLMLALAVLAAEQ